MCLRVLLPFVFCSVGLKSFPQVRLSMNRFCYVKLPWVMCGLGYPLSVYLFMYVFCCCCFVMSSSVILKYYSVSYT